jgi:hypothetical protein
MIITGYAKRKGLVVQANKLKIHIDPTCSHIAKPFFAVVAAIASKYRTITINAKHMPRTNPFIWKEYMKNCGRKAIINAYFKGLVESNRLLLL